MFYTHKTWADSNLPICECWREGEVMGIHTHVNSWNRLIMLHVGELLDFFLHAHHIYKAGLQAWDFRGQMTATDFEKWGAEKLTQPVLVPDDSPCHCLQVDRPMSTCIVKTGMIWLCRKGVVSDETISKNDLPVNSSTAAQREINRIDRILANHGQAVQLLLYVWPKRIELTWA